MNYGYVYPHPKQAWWYNPQALSAHKKLGLRMLSDFIASLEFGKSRLDLRQARHAQYCCDPSPSLSRRWSASRSLLAQVLIRWRHLGTPVLMTKAAFDKKTSEPFFRIGSLVGLVLILALYHFVIFTFAEMTLRH